MRMFHQGCLENQHTVWLETAFDSGKQAPVQKMRIQDQGIGFGFDAVIIQVPY